MQMILRNIRDAETVTLLLAVQVFCIKCLIALLELFIFADVGVAAFVVFFLVLNVGGVFFDSSADDLTENIRYNV